MDTSIVNVKNIRKMYDSNAGVEDISFELNKGDILGLLGQNGAGKSTVLRLLMNVLKKDSGNIKIFGEEYDNKEKYIKSKIGFVYDELHYDQTQTIEKAKKVIGRFYSKWDNLIFDEYIQKFELPAKKIISSFSKGMKMKFGIAIALSHNAELLIMDEPTSGLDPVVRDEILGEILKVNKSQGASIIFSSHITSDIEKIANKIVIIHKGKTVISDSKFNILNNSFIIEGETAMLEPEFEKKLDKIRKKVDTFVAITKDSNYFRKLQTSHNLKIRAANIEDIMLAVIKESPSKGLG